MRVPIIRRAEQRCLTAHHGKSASARDDEGDGFHEVHVNTRESSPPQSLRTEFGRFPCVFAGECSQENDLKRHRKVTAPSKLTGNPVVNQMRGEPWSLLRSWLRHSHDQGADFVNVRGFWSLLRSWRRPHRRLSQEKLPSDLAFFPSVYHARKRGKALLESRHLSLAISPSPDDRRSQVGLNTCIVQPSLR